MLVKYIRDGKRPIGCVVALSATQVGFSLCSPKDKFNKEIAVHLAVGRAVNPDMSPHFAVPNRLVTVETPVSTFRSPLYQVVEAEISNMEHRAQRYFKSPALA